MKIIKIGRTKDNDIVLNDQSVSSEHAQLIIEDNGTVRIKDLNSTNGTFINGQRIQEAEIKSTDKVSVAHTEIDWTAYVKNESVGNIVKTISIGRAPSNGMVFTQGDVSSYHAKVFTTDAGKTYIEDNDSTNGTYVNGQRIKLKQLVPGDKVLLANAYELDWNNLFDKGKTVISSQNVYTGKKESKPEIKKGRVKVLLIATIIMAVIGLGLTVYKPVKSWFAPVDVNAMYKNSVVLIYHSYVYEILVKDKPAWYITTGPEGNLVFYDEKTTSPIGITGTGFFISSTGEIITNRHVALPWEYEDNGQKKEEVLKAIKDFIKANYNANVASVGDFENIVDILSNVKVTGKTINLGIVLNDSYFNSLNDIIQCVSLKQSQDPKIDVALMQTKSKTLPDKVTNYVNLNEAVIDDSQLKNGDKLYLIGYPAGFSLARTNKGIMVNTQDGQITRESDGIDFGHNIPTIGGASGSPVFNKDGKLVGINYQGMVNTQGFNMAILAKHIVELAK